MYIGLATEVEEAGEVDPRSDGEDLAEVVERHQLVSRESALRGVEVVAHEDQACIAQSEWQPVEQTPPPKGWGVNGTPVRSELQKRSTRRHGILHPIRSASWSYHRRHELSIGCF